MHLLIRFKKLYSAPRSASSVLILPSLVLSGLSLSLPAYSESDLNPLVQAPEKVSRCISTLKSKPSANEPALTQQKDINLEDGITIFAKEVDYQPDEKLKLDGQVEFTHGPYKASSERALIDVATDTAELVGDIELRSPDLILKGDSASMEITSENVSVTNASFINPETSVNGQAELISRPDENTLVIKDGLFSSCPPNDRDWAFASSEITLDKESGFGEAESTRFLIKDVPVLYIPWFSFPIDDRRKTGFLYPTIGTSNTERGIFFSTPYYLNLAPNYDATLTPSYIHGRGKHFDLESRHKSRFTDTDLILGYINEDNYYRDEELALNNDDPGSRWGISFKQAIKGHEHGWYGNISYAQVSDYDYLYDLNQGLNIDRTDNLDRRAEFYLARGNWRFSALLQQYKTLEETVLPNEKAYQRLPELNYEFDWVSNAIHLDWHSQYVYFFREKDGLVNDEKAFGSRFRHTPKLSIPMTKSWGYLTPSFTLDHTDYALQAYSPVSNHISRTIPIYELDTSIFFDRESLFSENQFFRSNTIRHSLEPRLYYVFSKNVDQDDIPNFDSTLPSFNYQRLFSPYRFSGGDRVGDNNRVTMGITNRWTDMSTGEEKAVVSIGQIYHFGDRRVSIDGIGQSDTSESTIAADLIFRPYPGLELAATTLWDSETNETQEGNSRIHFYSEDYRHVMNFSHRYVKDELEQIDSSFITPLYQQMSLIGRWRYDLETNRTIGTLAGIEYGSCCWRIQALGQSYLDSDSDIVHGVVFRFQLKGVGGFGQSTRTMDQHIPGYAAREERFN